MASRDRTLDFLGVLHLRPQAFIYATIVALASLAVYDDEDTGMMEPADAWSMTAVILGPLVALAVAHFFADLAEEQIVAGRAPTRAEVGHMVTDSLQYLYVAVPSVAIVWAAMLSGQIVDDTVTALYFCGVASLFAWGFVVAYKTHAHGWVRWALTLGYGMVGVLIVVAEGVLSPH